jgi:hypothetical protein
LITQRLRHKLVLLQGFDEMATGFQRLALPFMSTPGLFERQKLVRTKRAPRPAKVVRSETGARGRSLPVSHARALPFTSSPASEAPCEEDDEDDDELPIAAAILNIGRLPERRRTSTLT